MGQRDCSGVQEVVMIVQREREREEVVGAHTNDATWRPSYGDGETTVLNRDGRWCYDGEMVSGAWRRD
jgi:hypothetical protein